MYMKKTFAAISLIASLLIIASPAFAYSVDLKLIHQDPFPAQRGEAVDLFFKAVVTDTEGAPKNLVFKIFPKYPFTAVSDPTVEFGDMTSFPFEEPLTFKFRVLVDENADEGDGEVEVGYSSSPGGTFAKKDYNVSIAETRTDFEVVIQDIQDNDISLGIANSGKSSASSVTVKVPKQDDFDVVGVSSNVIGDLDKGDFTIVTFKIEPKTQEEKDLLVNISYTDSLGNRYTLQKSVPLEIVAPTPEEAEAAQARSGPLGALNGSIWVIVSVVVAIIIAVVVYKIVKRKRK